MFEPLASLDVTLAQFPEVCMCCGYDRDSMYTAQVGFVGEWYDKTAPMRWADNTS